MTKTEITPTRRAELFVDYIENLIERGDKATRELSEKMATDPLYALRWANDPVKLITTGELAKELLRNIEDSSENELHERVEAAAEDMKGRLTRDLLNDRWRGSSSNDFDRALDAVTRAAVSDFLSYYLNTF